MKNKNKEIKKQEISSKKKKTLITYLVSFGIVLVIAGVVLAIVLLTKNNDKEEEIVRFEDLTHISVKQFNALIGKSTSDDDFGDLDSGFKSQQNLYVFVYNPNYDDCQECEELEELIKSKALKNEFSILVMNYEENSEIAELYNLQLPDRPALIHIEGEQEITSEKIFIGLRNIQLELAGLN